MKENSCPEMITRETALIDVVKGEKKSSANAHPTPPKVSRLPIDECSIGNRHQKNQNET